MSRRRKLLLFALVLGATAVYALWRAPDWGARLVEHRARALLPAAGAGRGARRCARPRREIELRGLRVGGITPDAPPFLEVPVVRVRPSLAPAARQPHRPLPRARRGAAPAHPRLPLAAARPRGRRHPEDRRRRRGGGGLQVAIERLVIVGGEFVLNHERVPLDLDLPDFRGRLAGRPEGGLAGHLSFGPGRLKMGARPRAAGRHRDRRGRPPRASSTSQGARLVAEKTNLAYHGRIRLAGRPQGQLSLEGPVDLAVLEKHVFRSGLGFEGAARWNGLLSIDGSRLRIEGRMDGHGRAPSWASPSRASRAGSPTTARPGW